jgi:hypothetical protein
MNDRDYFILNNNAIYYNYFEKDLINFFSKLNYEIYFFWGNCDAISNLINLILNNNYEKKYLIFFASDYNDVIIDNIPYNFIIFRTGMYKSKKKFNEFIYPVLFCNDLNYSLVYSINPVEKTSKPKVCFSGSFQTYHLRKEWCDYLINSDILDCNIIDKGCFRSGTTHDLIENYLTSEFCFCPRGSGNFSIRFYETLYYGRIPVIIDTDIMLPFENLIDWNKYIIISKTIEELPEKIYDFWLKNDIYETQLNCKKLYNDYFSQKNISEKILEELLFNKLENNYVIEKNKIDNFISLGSNCCNGIALRNLELIKESLPFDSIVSSPSIIYDCLVNNFDKFLIFDNTFNNIDTSIINLFNMTYPDLSNYTNNYGIYFNHYNNLYISTLIETFNRRINRLYKILENSKKIIFFYSTELCIYSKEIRDLQDKNYEYLIKIKDLLKIKYSNLNFTIINFSLNKIYENQENIVNINIEYDINKMSDNMETHIGPIYDEYRNIIKEKIEKLIIF